MQMILILFILILYWKKYLNLFMITDKCSLSHKQLWLIYISSNHLIDTINKQK